MTWLADLDARIWQAIIAGTIVAVGWLVNGRQNRLAEERTRRKRLRDIHRALYAEIKQTLRNLGTAEDLVAYGDRMIALMLEDSDFIPFVAHERSDAVFRTVLPEIQILPRSSIDILVDYYGHVSARDALIRDLRGEAARRLEPSRRAALYADYMAVKVRMVRYGRDALEIIDIYAKEGPEAARKKADELEAARDAADRDDG